MHVPVTPEPSSQQTSPSTQAGLPSWQPHPWSPQAPADAPGSLQLPAPSQKPEQQSPQLSLQLHVVPQFTPSEIQVSDGVKPSQTPELLQKPEQQPLQLSPQLQLASQPAPLSVHGGGAHSASVRQVPEPGPSGGQQTHP